MEQKSSFWRVVLMSIVAIVCACVSACSSDDPEPAPQPKPDPKESGEVVFDIKLPEGNGGGTSENPAVVQKGETLDMTISQKSSYADPDGTVFSCEPKAEIKLSAKLDTVVAKDIASLTKVKDGSDIKSGSEGTSPVRHQTVQTFEIGGQNIVFDLSHEVYSYVNSLKDKIEMPYIKINQAKLGNAQAKEEAPQGRSAAVALTGVTVRPLAISRATTVTDSTMYEVNALFNLDIESVNAKTDAKQTLVFSVTYIGVVETVTELKDPEAVVSYVWDVKSGTNSTASPFIKTAGNPMEIWMNQSSRYSDEYGNEAVGEPKAKIKLSLAQDTIWANSLDELKKIVNKSDNVAESQEAKQVFGNDNQDITIDWSYEVATADMTGKEIPMPYYALEGVTLADVSVKELGNKVYQDKEADLYEITATFRQKATPKNITGAVVSEEIEYVVSYVGAVEIKLVKVEYIPSGKWVDPHDNMHLAYYPKVERYRTYSNGKRIGPDEFYDYGHPVTLGVDSDDARTYQFDDQTFTLYTPSTKNTGDSIVYRTRSFEFSTKAGDFSYELGREGYTSELAFTDYKWDKYTDSRLYSGADVNIAEDIKTSHPESSRLTGWYFSQFIYFLDYRLKWQMTEWDNIYFFQMSIPFIFYDQFLVIDGRRIDFTSLHNLAIRHNISQTNFSDGGKEGAIIKLEFDATYLGKRFHETRIDSLYVAK